MSMDTDLRFWDALEGGEGDRGRPDLRADARLRAPGLAALPGRPGPVRVDLARVSGPANLAQALIHRLLTRVGELAPLGHPAYGSRLHLLAGERNTPANQRLAKLFVLEALAQEERIRRDRIDVNVAAHPTERNAMTMNVTVEPTDRSGPLQFQFPFGL